MIKSKKSGKAVTKMASIIIIYNFNKYLPGRL